MYVPVWWTRRQPRRPLTYGAVRAVLQRVNDHIGTNMTLHDLRHTCVFGGQRPGTIRGRHPGRVASSSTVDDATRRQPDLDEVIGRVRAHHQRSDPVVGTEPTETGWAFDAVPPRRALRAPMTTGVLDQGRPLAELLSSTPLAHSSASRDKIVELLTQRLPQAADLVRERVAAVGVLLNWLEAFPGDDWQTRWSSPAPIMAVPTGGRRHHVAPCAAGLSAVVLDVVRPQPSWFARATPAHLFVAYRRLHEPDTFDPVEVAIAAEDATRTSGMIALNTLTRVRLHIGVDLLEVDPAGFSRVVEAYRATGRRLVAVELAWRGPCKPSAVSSALRQPAAPRSGPGRRRRAHRPLPDRMSSGPGFCSWSICANVSRLSTTAR